MRAVGRSETLGLARFDSVQPRYNLLFRQIEREMLPFCAEEGVGVIPYNPIAGGLLSGKHERSAPPGEGTRFTLGTAGGMYQQRYWHDIEFDTVDQLGQLAKQAGLSLVTMAVAWCWPTRPSRLPSSAPAAPASSTPAWPPWTLPSTPISSSSSTSSPTSTAWATPLAERGLTRCIG